MIRPPDKQTEEIKTFLPLELQERLSEVPNGVKIAEDLMTHCPELSAEEIVMYCENYNILAVVVKYKEDLKELKSLKQDIENWREIDQHITTLTKEIGYSAVEGLKSASFEYERSQRIMVKWLAVVDGRDRVNEFKRDNDACRANLLKYGDLISSIADIFHFELANMKSIVEDLEQQNQTLMETNAKLESQIAILTTQEQMEARNEAVEPQETTTIPINGNKGSDSHTELAEISRVLLKIQADMEQITRKQGEIDNYLSTIPSAPELPNNRIVQNEQDDALLDDEEPAKPEPELELYHKAEMKKPQRPKKPIETIEEIAPIKSSDTYYDYLCEHCNKEFGMKKAVVDGLPPHAYIMCDSCQTKYKPVAKLDAKLAKNGLQPHDLEAGIEYG